MADDRMRWLFREQSAPETTPMVLHVVSEHHPDGVLGNVCVACLQTWPCPFWNHLREMALTLLNMPPEQLRDAMEQVIALTAEQQEIARVREESEGGERRPINLLVVKQLRGKQ